MQITILLLSLLTAFVAQASALPDPLDPSHSLGTPFTNTSSNLPSLFVENETACKKPDLVDAIRLFCRGSAPLAAGILVPSRWTNGGVFRAHGDGPVTAQVFITNQNCQSKYHDLKNTGGKWVSTYDCLIRLFTMCADDQIAEEFDGCATWSAWAR